MNLTSGWLDAITEGADFPQLTDIGGALRFLYDQRDRRALQPLAAETTLEHGQDHGSDHHPEQECGALQETEVAVREVHLDVPGPERADGQGRQEGPDPHRPGDADARADVEDEIHRAVP